MKPYEFDPEQENVNSVIGDRFDKALWDEARDSFGALEEMVTDLKQEHDYVDDFTLDVFNLLAKGLPELREAGAMRDTHVPLWSAVSSLTDMTELQELRTYTAGDSFAASSGLLSLRQHLVTVLQRAEELKEQVEEARKAQQEAQAAAQAAQDNPDDTDAQEAAEQAAQAAAETQSQLDTAIDATQAGMRKGARDSLKQAAADAEEQEQMARTFGLEPGNLQRMNFKERAELAQRFNSDKFRRFADLAGRFSQMAHAERRRRVKDVADETVGVQLGDDLTRLTTQEQINLASPELEDDFWLRYANKELLVKEMRGRDRQGRGAILCIVDESASMNGDGEMWAKALALALLNQAKQQKRDFHYIGFSIGPLRQFELPAGTTNQADALEMIEGFLNGGTDFSPPLRRAMELIDVTGKKRPDVIFITDGEASTPEFINEWVALKKSLDVTCYGIQIDNYYGGMSLDALTLIADDVRTVKDLTDPHQVKDIIRQS